MTSLLLLHAGATLAMTGLIWFVQRVHYPLFSFAAKGDFHAFALHHQKRTTSVVLPLMILELGTGVALVLLASGLSQRLAIAGLALLAMIWISTAAVQVPLHQRLAAGFDRRIARRLVRTNWTRTLAWTVRSGLALALLAP